MEVYTDIIIRKLNEMKDWNIENVQSPNLFNAGLSQAIGIVNAISRGEDPKPERCIGVHACSDLDMHVLKKEIESGRVISIPLTGKLGELFLSIGSEDDSIWAVFPDGTERICLRENVSSCLKYTMERCIETKERKA